MISQTKDLSLLSRPLHTKWRGLDLGETRTQAIAQVCEGYV